MMNENKRNNKQMPLGWLGLAEHRFNRIKKRIKCAMSNQYRNEDGIPVAQPSEQGSDQEGVKMRLTPLHTFPSSHLDNTRSTLGE